MLETANEGHIRYWNRRLAEAKPGLALAWAGENARGPGIIPNRWHVRWRDPVDKGAPDTYFAVTTGGIGEPGEFREMGSDVVEAFRAFDLWDSRVRRDRERRERLVREANERAKALAKEQRVYEIAANVNALDRPSVLVSDDVRWTNRAGARRAA